jgi:L-asparaginase II
VLVGHGGGTGVSAGYVGFLRERGLGIAIGCNAQPDSSPETLAMELLASMTETDPVSILPISTERRRRNRRRTER